MDLVKTIKSCKSWRELNAMKNIVFIMDGYLGWHYPIYKITIKDKKELLIHYESHIGDLIKSLNHEDLETAEIDFKRTINRIFK